MNNSLGTFMVIAAVMLIIATLLFGVAYDALKDKNDTHEDLMKTEHQIESK